MVAVTGSEKLVREKRWPKRAALRVGAQSLKGPGCGHFDLRGTHGGMQFSWFASQEDLCTWRQMGKVYRADKGGLSPTRTHPDFLIL